MFFFFPGQGLVEHILVDISQVMVENYVKKKVMLDEKMGKVAKGERKKKERKKVKKKQKKKKTRKEKRSVPLCSQFLKFYVDGA